MVVSEPGQPSAASKPAAAPVEQVSAKQGGIVTRYESATGQITRSGMTRASVAAGPSTEGFSVRSETGPIPLAMAKGSDVVMIPQLGAGKAGETSVDAAVMAGFLIPNASGRGFSVAPGMGEPADSPAPVSQKDAPPKVEEKPVVDPDDITAEGIPGTTAGADFIHGKLRDAAGPTLYAGLVQRMIVAGDPSDIVESIAQKTGRAPAEIREEVQGVFAEYETSAKAVAAKAGVPNHAWDAFLAWSAANQPDAALTAMDRFVTKHEFTGLARLAKQFSRTGQATTAYSDDAILAANFGPGVSAFRDENGRVMLRLEGHGAMTLQKAHAAGLVRLS